MTAVALAAASSPSSRMPSLVVRGGSDELLELPMLTVTEQLLETARLIREFRNHHGQRHLAGFYWAVTERGQVGYESRLEFSRLLFADFDPRVRRIVSQPFMLRDRVDGKVRKHIPDFLLLTSSGPVVVAVKPAFRLEDPKVAFTFAWTRKLVEAMGWGFEVFSEPDPVVASNLRFIAGFRRVEVIPSDCLADLRSRSLVGLSVGEVTGGSTMPGACVRAALFHLP